MTLRSPLLFFAFLLSATFTFAAPSEGISFIENDLELAKAKAAKEGKLIMVDFWATWCSPCRWMDEQTFSKSEVAEYLNENYISVRVDIDNFDGMSYKEHYEIRYLPTILVLDKNGNVVKKYEESFAPSKLIEVLKEHDADKMPIRRPMVKNMTRPTNEMTEPVKAAPVKKYEKQEFIPSTTGSSEGLKNNIIRYAPLTDNNIVSNTPLPSTTYSPIYEPMEPSTKSNSPHRTKTYTPTENSVAEDRGLWILKVREAPRTGFSVQVGLYYNEKNAMAEVNKFQKQFAEEVLVHISEFKGTTCYKVMLGHYIDRNEATQDKAILQEAGVADAFVKDLSTL